MDLKEMIAQALPEDVLAIKPPPPVETFDWDVHQIITCTWDELLDGTKTIGGMRYDQVVGIDTGGKFPRPCSIEYETERYYYIASKQAYQERTGYFWEEDFEVDFTPYWMTREVPVLIVEGSKKVYTCNIDWVIRLSDRQIKARKQTTKAQGGSTSARRAAQLAKKRARTAEYNSRKERSANKK